MTGPLTTPEIFTAHEARAIACSTDPERGFEVRVVMYAEEHDFDQIFYTGPFGMVSAKRHRDGRQSLTRMDRDDQVWVGMHLTRDGALSGTIQSAQGLSRGPVLPLALDDYGPTLAAETRTQLEGLFSKVDQLMAIRHPRRQTPIDPTLFGLPPRPGPTLT